jgi:hypothetical protein
MNQDPYQEESLDLKNIIFRYLPYWYLFVLSVMLALGLAYFIQPDGRACLPVFHPRCSSAIAAKAWVVVPC